MTEYEKVYAAYFKPVYLYLLRLSGSKSVSEEITNETFFRALRALDSFRGECSIYTWLCRIAKNCYFDHQKRQTRGLRLKQDAPVPPTTEDALLFHDDAQRVSACLHALPEPYREVFMWRVFGEMSFREIGKLFGKPENWACVTYHRARNKIRKELEDQQHES